MNFLQVMFQLVTCTGAQRILLSSQLFVAVAVLLAVGVVHGYHKKTWSIDHTTHVKHPSHGKSKYWVLKKH